jgi:methylenetetrahydrofolate reductase (NADPH)
MTASTSTSAARNERAVAATGQAAIVELCRDASVEMSFHDTARLQEASTILPEGTRVFISHLPKQKWEQTIEAAIEVADRGLSPVPHIPARLVESARTLDGVLEQLARRAGVTQVLLIAGDRPDPVGPFTASAEVLRTGLFEQHGIKHVHIAGHPEEHPRVAAPILRAAEEEKVGYAAQAGFSTGFVTQFAFDSQPIIEWIRGLRARGIRNGVRVGLAGPARLSTLLQYAARCGVGPSMRAFSSRAASFGRLLSDRGGPESLVRELSKARGEGVEIEGIHLFSFGGLVRTCRWIQAVGQGRFTLDDAHGFVVEEIS